MVAEEDFTLEEKELVVRITQMESVISDIEELETESAELLKLGAITEAQVATARSNLGEAKSMLGISTRRLERMVAKRREA